MRVLPLLYKIIALNRGVLFGETEVFEEGSVTHTSCALLSSTQAIVCYRDIDNSNQGTANLINISGNSLEAQTAVVFEGGTTSNVSVVALSSTQAVVGFTDDSDSYKVKVCVLNISGNTITPVAAVVVESNSSNAVDIVKVSSSQLLIAFNDFGSSTIGEACLLNISGSTITPQTPATFEAGATYNISLALISASQGVVCYRDNGDSGKGKACILDLSGNTVTPATPATFETGTTHDTYTAILSSSQGIVAYRDAGDSDKGKACLLNFSGSVVTPQTPTEFEAGYVYSPNIIELSSAQALVAYCDTDDSNKGKVCQLNISGNTITPQDPFVFEDGSTLDVVTPVKLSISQVLITYKDVDNSGKGTSVVVDLE